MGIYLNTGCGRYAETVASNVFVDKTEMILFLNTLVSTEQKYVCVSRPRRFGKSVAANMLAAYYGRGDGEALFSRCKVANHEHWDRYLAAFDVIRVVMTDFFREGVDAEKAITKLSARILDDLHESYPDVGYDLEDFSYSMERFYKNSGRRFVVIIDEWDAVFRECKNDDKGQTRYLDFLRGWLKDKEYIALAYMTGILPIKKYGKHSALNMFFEYSMVSPMQMAPYTGFTEEEVRELCEQFNMSYEDISAWYDGYRLSDFIPVNMREKYREGEYVGHLVSIFNPLSVINAVSTGIIDDYWNHTENYEALDEYICRDYVGLKEAASFLVDGGHVKVNTGRFQNDMTTFAGRDDILTLLVHLGYLGYDRESKEVYVPNKEILDAFKDSIEGSRPANNSKTQLDQPKQSKESPKSSKKKWKDRLATGKEFMLLVLRELSKPVCIFLVILLLIFLLAKRENMPTISMLNSINIFVTMFTTVLALFTWISVQSLRTRKPKEPSEPGNDAAILIVSIGNVDIEGDVITYCEGEERFGEMLQGNGFRRKDAFSTVNKQIDGSGYEIKEVAEKSRVVVLSREKIEDEHLADTADQIYRAFSGLENALHQNGISDLYIFYMGPIVVPFYIGELLSNRFNVYIYKYLGNTGKKYTFSGKMNHLEYMK